MSDQSRFDIATWALSSEPGQWSNLGDWTQAKDYNEACMALARRVGLAANLQKGQRALELAFGLGASLDLWQDEFQLSRVDGIEIRKSCVERVKKRQAAGRAAAAFLAADIDQLSCQEWSKLQRSHPEIFQPQQYHAILCVDAAYHFKEWPAFLELSHRLLAPGGRLAFCTLLRKKPELGIRSSYELRLFLRLAHIYATRQLEAETIEALFVSRGFLSPEIELLDQEVLLGFANYISKRQRQLSWHEKISAAWLKVAATARLCRQLYDSQDWHYVLVSSQKI